MSRAILYCRYSPRPKESDSIQAQAADLFEWCVRREHEVHAICFDPEISGAVPMFSRPGLAQALAMLKRNDLFVVRNLNRAARSIGVTIAIEEELERIGAQLVAVENGGLQPRKRDDMNAWFLRMIMALVSERERLEMNARTSRRMKQQQRNGKVVGSKPPYGWTIHNGELAQNEREQQTIGTIKTMHENGYGIFEIINKLHKHPSTYPPRGVRWHPTTIRRILKEHGLIGKAH